MGLFNKKELKRIEELEQQIALLNSTIEKTGAKEYSEIQQMIINAKKEYESKKIELDKYIQNFETNKAEKMKELEQLSVEIEKAKLDLFDISDEVTMQSFGLYTPKYDCMNSDEYAMKIKEIRTEQKNMIKNKTALNFYDEWVLNNSKAQGRAMNNDNMKMVLRAFNNECDVLIEKVKFNNFEKIKSQIEK